MAEVRAEKLVKLFKSKTEVVRAVDDVNVVIPDGEFAVFVGPSGSGKTTFLRLVAGLEVATSGHLYIGDRDVTTMHPRERGIAMVFQDYALYPHMTVGQNMSFALQNLRFPKAEIEARVKQAAKMLQIGQLLDRKPRQLSGGQRQRVALGRAIVRKPAVFLFDEPLSNLDAKLRAEMRVELSELHATLRTTAVYVTHDQVEALTLGDRIFVMNEGKVQQIGSGEELYDRPANAFVASFIGTPQINLIGGTVAAADGGVAIAINDQFLPLSGSQRSWLGPWTGKDVLLGIRPEHLGLGDIAPEQPSLGATVRLVEHLGPELFVHLDVSGNPLVARVPATTSVRAGETRRIGVNVASTHVFDAAEDQRRIAPPTA
jgi:multiple sugar transport system ATP-binding protein